VINNAAPLCFVLMPFGKKADPSGLTIDFDAVYQGVIKPAVVDAGLEPIRADEEQLGGIIHKPMFERLIFCPFAVADLTSVNANVFYELGVRHAVRPASTVLIFAEGGRLPFDVNFLRAIPYKLGADGRPSNEDEIREMLRRRLTTAREDSVQRETPTVDSPVFALLDGYPGIQREKTDVFRQQVEYSQFWKEKLAQARKEGVEALQAIEEQLLPHIDAVESGVLIDLFLSYRSVKAWAQMIAFEKKLPRPLAATTMVREQLALALNRVGKGGDSEQVLRQVLAASGPSSETYGLLGRVYKDRWQAALKDGDTFLADGVLDQAIDAYTKGFESDWRDAYPGINAVTLMELRDPPDPRRTELIPLVAYAAKRRIEKGQPDYWDYATLVELGVLAKDHAATRAALSQASARIREPWEPETTARNLKLILDRRTQRGEEGPAWVADVIAALQRRAG
jgi:hypothetical protein